MSFLLGNLPELLASLAGAVVILFGVWTAGKRRGTQQLRNRLYEEDRKGAKRVKEKVDEVLDDDRDVSATERLRKQGRLRD